MVYWKSCMKERQQTTYSISRTFDAQYSVSTALHPSQQTIYKKKSDPHLQSQLFKQAKQGRLKEKKSFASSAKGSERQLVLFTL